MTTLISKEEVASLVRPTRLHKRLYLDPDVFELEMERIWGQAWIFIGHESQVPNPGDFFTTNITHKIPVVMVRDKGDSVHVLHNRCGHKGAKLVESRQGNVRGAFRCPYHGWTFRHDGGLLKVPNESGYDSTGFDSSDPCYSMQSVAQVESYRGFVFATLSAEAPDLKTWLGGAIDCLDNLCDRAPEGEVEVAGGVLRYEHQCNWKFILENLNDTMHPMVVHQSVVQAAEDYIATLPESAVEQRSEAEIIPPFGSSYEKFEDSGITGFRYGHHYDGGKTSIHADYKVLPAYHDAMVKAYGEERTREIYAFNTHNTLYYPSLTIKSAVQNIRVVRPIAVDRFVVETWSFRLKGAPDEMLQRTLLYSRLINSSFGMVGPDDHEVYRRAQEGLESNASEWVEFHRQYGRDQVLEDRVIGGGTSDLDMRTQYKAWQEYMTGEVFQ
ncbi:aromatic ring-hydroxylating dioxygenase subunit alpha [Haliea sp. E1-2-M8]|uniref:aromatic ring-hydroxylating oxygenase subunit alpha n=1 Tax=Haliea sp. E1-2-M8 TaxID=3064706 RepID=UPI002718482D|nr:aromatic ring-hydroxylating dioxygenase subunit alpha [Haliea sp. E1-2-M8]MDO8861940.1 aromatic ring-hydroxylating dioxygenase subunit alpha [Haliea sp. E1-2-M8]